MTNITPNATPPNAPTAAERAGEEQLVPFSGEYAEAWPHKIGETALRIARADPNYSVVVVGGSRFAALSAAENEANDARIEELKEAARRAVEPRELFDALGIPAEMQDACFSDDTQDWIAWTFRSYLAALAAAHGDDNG